MEKEYINTIERWDTSMIDLCYKLYGMIEKEKKDERSVLLRLVCEKIDLFKENEDSQSTIHDKEKLNTLKMIYGDYIDETIKGIAKAAYLNAYEIEKEYKLLWDTIFENTIIPTEDKGFALYWIVIDSMLPYQSLSSGIQMDDDVFSKKCKRLSRRIYKIKYIINFPFGQKTEESSLILKELDAIRDVENRAVVLAIAMNEHTRKATYKLRRELQELRESSD